VNSFTKTVGSIGAIGALALGGSAFADAASNTSTTTSPTATAGKAKSKTSTAAKPRGRHVGANGKQEQALSTDVAQKVADAATTKLGGGTVIRTETDVDHGSPYEAHVQKSDGSQVEVLVNENFEVTAVNAMGQHP
jgi:hypothetical protein